MTVRRRQIEEADLGAIAELLARGFRLRPRSYWQRGLARMRARSVPVDYPRYGLLLESDGRIVGAILTIYSSVPVEAGCALRCNLSSWYLEPEFRSYAPLLASFRDPAATYVNISPAPNTWSTIEAQGFRCIRQGWFLSFPALSRGNAAARILPLSGAPRDLPERTLLEEHSALGCTVLVIESAGEHFPFVFAPRPLLHRTIPGIKLAYCRDFSHYIRFAGAIGRYLLSRGMPAVVLDNDPRARELTGFPIERKRRYYVRGPHPPRSGDLAYTETIFFGS
ncbi:MAG: hypothetical protein JOZ84_05645 [Methylobacteriaceae bacterium]|nr:hypothetical protein [Methylobacteriaceae bacterium]